MKKLLSILMALTMVSTFIPVGVLAASEAQAGTFSYSVTNGKATVIGYVGLGGDLTIPGTYNGYPVIAIGDKALDSLFGLTSVIIPDSVLTIGVGAFSSSGKLTSVTFGSGVTIIGESAFSNCNELTSVVIPNSVTTIRIWAFSSCDKLTSVTIGSGAAEIDRSAFYGCEKLTQIVVSDANTSYSSLDGVLFNKTRTNLIICPLTKSGDYAIPNSVKAIGNEAFARCKLLTSLTIGTSVTTIGDSAFLDCSGLTGTLTIPNSVVKIENDAFSGCNNLAALVMGTGVTAIGDYAFFKCSGLTGTLTISDNVTKIGNSSFSYCSKLTSVTVPDSVITIGHGAFSNCIGMLSASIGNSVTTIGPNAFSNCLGLLSVSIGNNVTAIQYNAFFGCTGLASVNIPDSVSMIGSDAFWDTAWYTNQADGLIYAGKVAYCYKGTMPANTAITFKANTKSIAEYAFYGCTGLTSVIIGSSVTKIEEGVFYNCTGLTSITIPDSVTAISGCAFYSCTKLSSVTIPDSLTSIGRKAFAGTAWFNNQPDGLVYLGKIAYKYKGIMPKNTAISLKPDTLAIADRAFIDADEEYIDNPSEASLYGYSGLKSVAIPAGVTKIGQMAFTLCFNLTEINVDAANVNYTSLDGVLFNKTKTTLIQYPIGKTVDAYAVPDGVTAISEWAFSGSMLLTLVTIPASVTTIRDKAFSRCWVAQVYFLGNAPEMGESVFSTGYSLKIYYLSGKTGFSNPWTDDKYQTEVVPDVNYVKIISHLTNGDIVNGILNIQIPWYMLYMNAAGYFDFSYFISSGNYLKAEWISDNPKIVIREDGYIQNKGMFSRSANITIKLTAKNGEVLTDTVKVLFYKYKWQIKN